MDITSAASGEVLREPIDQPCGVLDRAFRDPAGHVLGVTRPRER
ncbi:VOC family protein [Streptomyces sp. NPDC047886]